MDQRRPGSTRKAPPSTARKSSSRGSASPSRGGTLDKASSSVNKETARANTAAAGLTDTRPSSIESRVAKRLRRAETRRGPLAPNSRGCDGRLQQVLRATLRIEPCDTFAASCVSRSLQEPKSHNVAQQCEWEGGQTTQSNPAPTPSLLPSRRCSSQSQPSMRKASTTAIAFICCVETSCPCDLIGLRRHTSGNIMCWACADANARERPGPSV